ncbi:ShlB/FhaC/HecB family hemolysin secretion/activation protein [Salipiger sp. 1_MG-2023]|nr:ShlB/FhaC/HecB family hemolysin secretion/activation protein [Salipiger sp. 1_MG-2023]
MSERSLYRRAASPFLRRLMMLGALGICMAAPGRAQDLTDMNRALSGQTVILQRYAPPPQVGSVEIGVEDEREQIDMQKAERISFRLNSVTVEGGGTLSAANLAAIWQGRIGSQITLAELYRIADAVDAAYLAAGFFSKTVVPVQDYADGQIRLRVFEGYVDRIEIDSEIPGIDARLAPYLQRILAMHPIRVSDAERELLLMSDLAGLVIEGTFIRPEGASGGGVLHLEITHDRSSGMIALDNFGTDAVGPLQLASILELNDVYRQFESTNLTGVLTPVDHRQMALIQFGQSYPVGSSGLIARYNLVYLRQRPGGDLADLGIDVTSAVATAGLSYPFVRSLDWNLWGAADVTFRNDDVDVMGEAVSRSRSRWASFSLQYDRSFETGTFSAQSAFNIGTASDLDVGEVPGDFRFVTGGLEYSHPFGDKTAISFQTMGQYSGRELPGAVKLGVGGDPYGFGFDNGTISGDNGLAAAARLSHDFETDMAQLPTLSTSLFVDYGKVWHEAPDDGPQTEYLGSYGVGLGGMLNERVSFQLAATLPWTHSASVDEPGGKLLFQLVMPL